MLPARCLACVDTSFPVAFTMAFQPIVDVCARDIAGHEALVRGPQGEAASTILARLDATNLYAFDQMCRVRAIEIAGALGGDGYLAINFLPNAVYDPAACLRRTLAAAERTGLPLASLVFEISEMERIVNDEHLLAIIREYKRQGFSIALDDFATCYSGLSRLITLSPDAIKLDRAAVQDCDCDPVRRIIIKNMVRLTSDLGIKLITEGVERIEEAQVLSDLGVQFMQGFYFSRPVFQGMARRNDIAWP